MCTNSIPFHSILLRAKNKLDGCEYAIKKIILKYCDSELFAKIFREVTTLARLAHPNVVCYKGSDSDSLSISLTSSPSEIISISYLLNCKVELRVMRV